MNAYPERPTDRSSQSKPQFHSRSITTADNIVSRITEKLAEDVRGAIRITASEDTLARPDEKSYDDLCIKHPPRKPAARDALPLPDLDNNTPSLVVQERAIIDGPGGPFSKLCLVQLSVHG